MSSTSSLTSDDTGAPVPALARLWLGILGPPVIWAARISASYVLVPYVCAHDAVPLLHAITAVALAGTGFAGRAAWRQWSAARAHEHDTIMRRARFMALTGILSSALFFVVIIAEGMMNFFVHPCQNAGAPL